MDDKKKFNLRSLISRVTSVIFYLLIVALLIFSAANSDIKENDDVAHLLGKGFLSAESNLMNDTFTEGDLIIIKLIDNQSINHLAIGNIVTYYDETTKQFISHRIETIYEVNGISYIQTKADDSQILDTPIKVSEVIGIYESSVAGVGHSLNYLQSPKGFLFFIIYPVLLLLIYEILMFIKGLNNYNKSRFKTRFEIKYKKALKSLETETEKIRKQILSNWIR